MITLHKQANTSACICLKKCIGVGSTKLVEEGMGEMNSACMDWRKSDSNRGTCVVVLVST